MLNYIPGIIHESFQEAHFYEIVNDFVAIVCNDVRFAELDYDNDVQTFDIEIVKGNVIVLKYFKNRTDSTVYSYIEGYYNNSNEFIEINQESILSADFIKINEANNVLFNDITKIFKRDQTIDKILN